MELLTGYAAFHWVATWANPFWDRVFRTITDLGSPSFYYLALAPLLWLGQRRRAIVLFLLVLLSGYANTGLKSWFDTPRPDPNLARVVDLRPHLEHSPAFPSGHAQCAVVVWVYLAQWVGNRWFSALAALVIAAISFSRIYLGVHFPVDVVGGLALGVAMAAWLPGRLHRWASGGFAVAPAAAAAALLFAAAGPFFGRDITWALLSGSLAGWIVGALWLPPAQLRFGSALQAATVVGCGLLLLTVLSGVFRLLPPNTHFLAVQTAALWIVALWVYPQAVQRLWLRNPMVDTDSE